MPDRGINDPLKVFGLYVFYTAENMGGIAVVKWLWRQLY